MDYELHIDEDILDYHIQKLTLQPIVENALYHGIKNKRGKGLIEVYGTKDRGDIVFTIRDNGIGMKEDELERLRNLISGKIEEDDGTDQSGFGMANVEKRIEMLYGGGYGMTVDSVYMEGTTVTVRIPQK